MSVSSADEPPVVTAPFGTWQSPISSATVASNALRLGFVSLDGEHVYCVEGRPAEGGANVLVRYAADGTATDVTPARANVRTRVHEYGGGAYAVTQGTIVYSNFGDQRLYCISPAGSCEALTPDERTSPRTGIGDQGSGTGQPRWSYADFVLDLPRQRLIAVREDHGWPEREPVTALATVPLAGGLSAGDVIASGFDFYASPRLSPDGSMLAWIAWNHPQMPWDGTELWLADVTRDGRLINARYVTGGSEVSIYQPGWSPDGVLYFVSDRDGWWRLYRLRDTHSLVPAIEPVLKTPPADAEFGRPQWQFGTSTWAFAASSTLVVAYAQRGRWRLAIVDRETGTLSSLATELEPAEWIAATPTHAVCVGGSSADADALIKVSLATGATERLRTSSSLPLSSGYLSLPEALEFCTEAGLAAHLFYYPPRNRDFRASAGERPPLILMSHGGPTTATHGRLKLDVQFWTSRGFAVADVNYRGSTGYGRTYRQRLDGQWGIVDVADCVNAAKFLVATGRADARRLAIRGGSAGGYTTLCALTFHAGLFSAGASYYGVSDAEALARETHKFESRYLDRLIGPYPAAMDVYRARSPIHHVERLSSPLIVFQGLEDKIVPPSQAELMVEAMRAKGLTVAYFTFEGEQHGFRRAETIIRCLDEELAFYRTVFGLSA
jgi:dipeptidyl aminopeptidase/acylaminoacyl peptidase